MEIEELKDKIKTVIDMEQQSASMAPITPIYISRMLNVPLELVEWTEGGYCDEQDSYGNEGSGRGCVALYACGLLCLYSGL